MLACVPSRDYTASAEPALRPLLAGDEWLLAASPLVKDPGTTEDVSAQDELVNLLDPTILLGLGTHPGNAVQRAVFGRAVTGGPGSTARRLFDTVDADPAPKIAVTDRRLLIVSLDTRPRDTGGWRRWFGPSDMVATLVTEVPRVVILGAVAAPAGVLRRGRFLIGFTDGSGCVLVCAPPSLAEPVVAAIGTPREEPG
jgi:hypothetical protein